ncbi:MAG: ribonuclease P protein component [Candidatus Shapirobacteria bacterium]
MLPKFHRFTSRKDFSEVKRHGQLVSGRFWGTLFLKKAAAETPKFGFIISKKIDKRAVVRNRLRRQLSGAILPLLPDIGPGWGIIFLVKKSLLGQEFDEIKKEMAGCLKNLS